MFIGIMAYLGNDMDQTRLHQLEDQCIQDCDPPCTAYCPVHVNIRQMLKEASSGDFSAAYKTLRKSILFPEIIARTCDEPCKPVCNRASIGGSLRVAGVELAVCQYGRGEARPAASLPRKNGTVAVIGGGLCGLTAAHELARKGYSVTLFEAADSLGGGLRQLPQTQLPAEVLERETGVLLNLGIDLRVGQPFNLDAFPINGYDAVLLAPGSDGVLLPDLETGADGRLLVDPVTFQTSRPGVFAGGSLLHARSTIRSLSDGKRAAISIDRHLQKVSLTASRENEAVYDTRLVTRIDEIPALDAVIASAPAGGYSREEAASEAARCIQCDCMECVKVCEYLAHYGSYPRKYVREIYNNLSIIMRVRSANKMINSCTLCGLCKGVCPTDLDMGAVSLETRRTMVNKKKMPISAHDFALRDMAFSNSDRFILATGPPNGSRCETLFFPGCQLAASNPEYIPLIYQDLARTLPGLGIMLRCCGAPADWSGETDLFEDSGAILRNEWEALGKPRLVLACSSCDKMLKTILPGCETMPLWQELTKAQIEPAGSTPPGGVYRIHDPCTSRYERGWQDSARQLLEGIGVEFGELKMSRDLTECCGYGGVVWLANPELTRKIINRRINEDAGDYITYCVMCRDLFAAEGKPTLHILDLLYSQDVAKTARRKPPDYSQRHENRMRVKQKMVRLLQGKDVDMAEPHENYRILLSTEMRQKLESRLILTEDVQRVIEHAETSGEFFLNQETGHALAYFKPNLITYWVEYSKSGEAYEVFDAYSHRMEFGGDTSV